MSNIKKTEFIVMGEKTTICLLTTLQGFEIVGVSSCVDPTHFDKELGKKLSLKAAMNELNQFKAYVAHYPNDLPF